MYIQSYLPKAPKLVGGIMEAKRYYAATRETGLSVTTEASKTMGVQASEKLFQTYPDYTHYW